MKNVVLQGNRSFAVWLLLVGSVVCSAALDAASSEQPETKSTAASALERGYSLQENDDPAFALKPTQPLSAAKQNRNDALSWFMAGRLLESVVIKG